jgi:hypothetical protein
MCHRLCLRIAGAEAGTKEDYCPQTKTKRSRAGEEGLKEEGVAIVSKMVYVARRVRVGNGGYWMD